MERQAELENVKGRGISALVERQAKQVFYADRTQTGYFYCCPNGIATMVAYVSERLIPID